ncbi:phosphatase PAP2 family protein [Croceiramulus getboli]|nr:phosphatase PAP2 family protein [Flavobacteriaceae bacterium YJPT1-3]
MEQLKNLDEQLFLLLNSWGSESWDGFWLIITGKWYAIPLYVFLLYLLLKKLGPKSTVLVLILVATMITCTDQLANLFKYGFERPRPCQLEALMERGRFAAPRCGRYGFFSAHAASSMALAVFIGLLLRTWYRYLVFVLLFWAVLVGYSRIYLGVHYPGDVLVGFTLGALIAWGFFLLYRRLNSTFIQNRQP